MAESLGLELLGRERGDVYLAGAAAPSDAAWRLVQSLDSELVRVVAPPSDAVAEDGLIRTAMVGCAAVVNGDQATDAELRVASALAVPVCEGDDLVWDRIVPAFAFVVCRLERDFAHAREAIRTAVEREAGIACLWSDDGRHRTAVPSIIDRTRLLIRDASFVIADLTLGPESPERENPSRAHEIGMGIAFGRDVMLCSQEPRRYPYFSIADMQMTFWANEGELHDAVAQWIRITPGATRRRVLNFELSEPRLATPTFHYESDRRFVGPNVAV